MSHPWTAEREVTPELARALVREQFPELPAQRVEPFGSGWDNTAFLVDGDAVFRFPRKQSTVELLELESRVLPRLAGTRVPADVPAPAPAPRLLSRCRGGRPDAGWSCHASDGLRLGFLPCSTRGPISSAFRPGHRRGTPDRPIPHTDTNAPGHRQGRFA